MLDAGLAGGGDEGALLDRALGAIARRDDEDAVDAGQGRGQRPWLVEVARDRLDAGGEAGLLGRPGHGSHGDACGGESGDEFTADIAGGAGYQNHAGIPLEEVARAEAVR